MKKVGRPRINEKRDREIYEYYEKGKGVRTYFDVMDKFWEKYRLSYASICKILQKGRK